MFAGEQAFDLRPGRRDGRHLPIVLFGGINGGGKTTLLDAIQLALYGVRARCSKRSQMSYDDFLRESIHHGAPAGEPAGVALSFRYAANGEEHLYDVDRSWRIVEGRLREDLRVLKDGVPSLWLADNWPQMMEELFPLDISQLFFFDAEKIRTLAEDESSSKALGAAIKSLLGLDIVERLITDSTVLQTRLEKKGGTPEQRAQVEALELAFREQQTQLDGLTTERAALENTRLRAETEEKEAEAVFAAGGGKHWHARDERNRRLVDVKRLEEELRSQLVALAAGELPLALLSDQLASIAVHDQRERETKDAVAILRLLLERDNRLLAVVREARGSPVLLRRIAEHLEADRDARQPTDAVPHRFELAEPARGFGGWPAPRLGHCPRSSIRRWLGSTRPIGSVWSSVIFQMPAIRSWCSRPTPRWTVGEEGYFWKE